MYINIPTRYKCSKCGSLDISRPLNQRLNDYATGDITVVDLHCNNCGHERTHVESYGSTSGKPFVYKMEYKEYEEF